MGSQQSMEKSLREEVKRRVYFPGVFPKCMRGYLQIKVLRLKLRIDNNIGKLLQYARLIEKHN